MTPLHGAAAVTIAAATRVAADHSITVAVITAAAGVAVVVIGPIVNELLRRWRHKTQIDHRAEMLDEYSELVEHLRAELVDKDGEINDLRNELRRERRRRG